MRTCLPGWSESEMVQSMTILGKRCVNKAVYLRELHKSGEQSSECRVFNLLELGASTQATVALDTDQRLHNSLLARPN
jgi:hypothetical protein